MDGAQIRNSGEFCFAAHPLSGRALRARAVAPPRRPASLTLRRTREGDASRVASTTAPNGVISTGQVCDGLLARARVVRARVARMKEASALVARQQPEHEPLLGIDKEPRATG